MTAAPAWELRRFLEAFDEWCEDESPDTDLRAMVLAWILSRTEDPYEGVQRQSGFPNLWFAQVPRTARGWEVVVCSYWILEREHTVRCDRIATLNSPV